jgi:hypothetical protein
MKKQATDKGKRLGQQNQYYNSKNIYELICKILIIIIFI